MASPFRHPEFLEPAKEHEPTLRMRCPVHGFLHYSKNEQEIIDHRLFRRLRFIKQLALTDFLYPGATHTRFEHSLGVMHVATLAFDRLASIRGDVLEAVFQKVDPLKDHPLAIARQVLRLAALLHDVGHAPFSHAAEKVIHQGAGHEELTIDIIEEPSLLGGDIDKFFFPGCAELVAMIIRGGDKLYPQLQILRNIVSGQMDADRTDYLLRDSLHCGVEYGRFDYLRMIECLALIKGPGGSLEIALDRGGIHTFEALILSRYQMNSQVYRHKVRQIYDVYLEEYFKAKGQECFDPPEKILSHNDVTMMARIFQDAEKNEPCSEWARRIVERHHHRIVHQTGESTNASELRHSKKIYTEIKEKFSHVDFIHNVVKAEIHNLLLPDDQEEGSYERLLVIDRAGVTRLMGEQSHILRHVPRKFQIARIFGDFSHSEDGTRREATTFAAARYRELGGR